MKRFMIIFIVAALLFFAQVAYSAGEEDFRFAVNTGLANIKPKKPVRITVKRTVKDGYTWELKGDDTDEIIRINKKLRKELDRR